MAIVWNESDECGIEALKELQKEKGKHCLLVSEGREYNIHIKVVDDLKANNFLYDFFDLNNDRNISEVTGIEVERIGANKVDTELVAEALEHMHKAINLLIDAKSNK